MKALKFAQIVTICFLNAPKIFYFWVLNPKNIPTSDPTFSEIPLKGNPTIFLCWPNIESCVYHY